MIDFQSEPGSYIQKANNIALTNAFKKLLNARPDITIPFFFEKGDKKYMGRAKTLSSKPGQYPTYYINFFELAGDDDNENMGMNMLKNKILARNRFELEERLYDFYENL